MRIVSDKYCCCQRTELVDDDGCFGSLLVEKIACGKRVLVWQRAKSAGAGCEKCWCDGK